MTRRGLLFNLAMLVLAIIWLIIGGLLLMRPALAASPVSRAACPVGMPSGYTCSPDGAEVVSPAGWVLNYGPDTACAILRAARQYGAAAGYAPPPAHDTARGHCEGLTLAQVAPSRLATTGGGTPLPLLGGLLLLLGLARALHGRPFFFTLFGRS